MTNLVIISLCIAVYIASFFCDVSVVGVSGSSPWWSHFTYIFAHRSLFHVSCNLFVWTMLRKSCMRIGIAKPELFAIASAFISSFAVYGDDVTVGISGGIYAMLGMILVVVHSKEYVESLALIVIVNIVVAVFGRSNWLIHGLSFLFGFLTLYIWTTIRKKLKS